MTILSKNHSLSGQEIKNISKTSKGDFHQEHFTGKTGNVPVSQKIKKTIKKRENIGQK